MTRSCPSRRWPNSGGMFVKFVPESCDGPHNVDIEIRYTYPCRNRAKRREELNRIKGTDDVIGSISPLRESELFNRLSDEALDNIALLCSETIVAEGVLLFSQDRKADRLYIVTEGLVALQMATRVPHATQSRRTTVAICGQGEVVGWSSMVEPFQYTLTAMVWEACRLISIDAELLRKAAQANPNTGFQIMQALSAIMSRRIRQITTALVSERETLAARLNSMSEN